MCFDFSCKPSHFVNACAINLTREQCTYLLYAYAKNYRVFFYTCKKPFFPRLSDNKSIIIVTLSKFEKVLERKLFCTIIWNPQVMQCMPLALYKGMRNPLLGP